MSHDYRVNLKIIMVTGNHLNMQLITGTFYVMDWDVINMVEASNKNPENRRFRLLIVG